MKVKASALLALLMLGMMCATAQSPYNTTTFSPATVITATSITSAAVQLGPCGQPGGGGTTRATSWSSGNVTLTGVGLTTATFAVLGSSDCGTTYTALAINPAGAPSAVSTTITATAAGIYQVNLSGINYVKFQTSGTFTATSISLLLTASPQGTIGRSGGVAPVTTTPLACSGAVPLFSQYSNGDVWSCNNGTPVLLAVSGSGVQSFSSGPAAPFFSTSVANPNSTPNQSFSVTPAAQGAVLSGPCSGGSGTPSYQTAPCTSAANMTNFPASLVPCTSTNNALQKNNAGTPGCSTVTDDGVDPVQSPDGVDVATAGGYNAEYPNASSVGTAAQTLTCDDGTGHALICPHSTSVTNQTIGAAVAGAGTTGNVTTCFLGWCPYKFDNTAVPKDFAIESTTTDGYLHDTGSTVQTPGQSNFFVWSANAGAGTAAQIRLLSPDDLIAATSKNGKTGATLQTAGSNNTLQNLLNFIASTVNATGLTATPSNPSGGQEKIEITGNLAAANVAPGALANGMTVTTQLQLDGSNRPASTSYADTAVSNAIAGVNPAVAVLAASIANVVGTYIQVGGGIGDTFTVTATGAFTLDGIAINTIGQRVLLKNQSTASQNGVYTATIVGSTGISPVFTRALDYDTPSDVNNTGSIPVQSGTVNTTTSWLLTSQVTSIGSGGSSLTYAQFSLAPSTVVTSAAALGSTRIMTGAGGQGAQTPSANATIDGSGNMTAAQLLATGIVDGQAPVTITTGTSASLGGTFKSGYTFNQEGTAATAVTYTLPTAAAGLQYCVANSYNGSAANTGALELLTSASGQFIIYTDGTLSATGGYVISGGAARDSACVVGVDSTHWLLYVSSGSWAKH